MRLQSRAVVLASLLIADLGFSETKPHQISEESQKFDKLSATCLHIEIGTTDASCAEGRMDRLNRIAAYASFVLAFQFAATLFWIIVSWPPTGLSGLAGAMAASFLAQSQSPLTFALINLYNASFAASALVVVTTIKGQLLEFPYLMKFGLIGIIIAATLFLASGIIPIVSVPELVRANDTSAIRAISGVATGLVLGATTAAGAGVVLTSSALLASGRVPKLLCYIGLVDGLMQIVEFTTPPFMILDPSLGTIWSLWLGSILWRAGLAAPRTQAIRI